MTCPRCGHQCDTEEDVIDRYLDTDGVHVALVVCPRCGTNFEVED